MTKWTQHPPRTPGLYNFRGVRVCYNNQTISYAEPVRVQQMEVGQRTSLGVAMLGKQRIYQIGSFHGEWAALEDGLR